MIHINIASLRKHIDELRGLLTVLNYPFDIIGITETRLRDDNPLVNIEIDGYIFKHTPTKTACVEAGIYVKSSYEFDIKQNLSKSYANISESIFIEIKRGHENVIIGCIYRHHSPIPTFIDIFFNNTLEEVSRQVNKTCAIMGYFNVDLTRYASDSKTAEFYDLMCSHSFRPLILQPTRVTSKTTTLIDNIFIDDITCHTVGGNITSSISDHLCQFTQTDIFSTSHTRKKVNYSRDFRNFNKQEFNEELLNIDWSTVINESLGTVSSYLGFYDNVEDILNHMAPYRKMTQRNVRLEQRPWITHEPLVSMKVETNCLKVELEQRIRKLNPNFPENTSAIIKLLFFLFLTEPIQY